MQDLQEYLNRHYPDAFIRQKYNIYVYGISIEILVSGPDPGVLKELRNKIQDIMVEEPSYCLLQIIGMILSLTWTLTSTSIMPEEQDLENRY